MFEVKFTPHGQKDLKRLPRDIQKRILNKIQFYSQQSDPLSYSKPLVNLPPTTHRFRVGDYRIAFYLEKQIIYIDRIKHRREVYE